MLKYKIELTPSGEESITIEPAEWAIIVIFSKHPDFNKMISELKSSFKMSSDEIKQALSSLQKKGMIKLLQVQDEKSDEKLGENSDGTPEEDSADSEPSEGFWEKITEELSRAIGPIADIVIDDAVGEFNTSRSNFPTKYLYSLVEKVAAEINTPAEKSQFQKAMLEFIKQSM